MLDNLLEAWREFLLGKRHKPDVQAYGLNMMDNLINLQRDLVRGNYQHSGYYRFSICDPKPREIHKATVRDRVLNHAIYRQLYPFFDRIFIADSFSCRQNKGTHAAMQRFRQMAGRVSRNSTRTCWVLKCDIQKFFASIDQAILMEILEKYIVDERLLELIRQLVDSFETVPGRGLPLGNLTSQLLVNVYMNEFDQFVKHKLKVRNYIRYADDFALLSDDRAWLAAQIPLMREFLSERLHLTLHPRKLSIGTMAAGVDFLGWVHSSDHKTLRTATKRRMLRNIQRASGSETMTQSYVGMLGYGNAFNLQQEATNAGWLWYSER